VIDDLRVASSPVPVGIATPCLQSSASAESACSSPSVRCRFDYNC